MNVFMLIVGVLSGWILASLRQIGPDRQGVLLFFGKPLRGLGAGLHFVPFLVCTLRTETKLVIQEQYPDNPENVWKGDEASRPPGKMPPIRVTHLGEDRADPLSRRMTTEISLVVRFWIDDLVVFIQTIGSLEEAKRQIRDTVTAKAREELAQKTPAQTLAEWDKINDCLKKEVEKLVGNWGMRVEDVRLEDVDMGHTVNKALRDVTSASLEKETIKKRAEGEKYRLENEGAGQAKARQLLLEAEAKGTKALAEELGVAEGETLLALNLLREALKQGNQVIISGNDGLADILKMVKAVTATTKNGGGTS